MIKIEIKNRWSGNVQFTAELECSEDTSLRVKHGLALKWAILSGADLSGADLRDADLRGADLRDAKNMPFIPFIPDLDGKILAALGKEGCQLEMSTWHTCETTHCRAGWAITLAGDSGRTLESIMGASAAGAIIYATCYPELKIPDFYTDNETALADIKARAALTNQAK